MDVLEQYVQDYNEFHYRRVSKLFDADFCNKVYNSSNVEFDWELGVTVGLMEALYSVVSN